MPVNENGVEYDSLVIELPVIRKYFLGGKLVATELGSAIDKVELVAAAQKDFNVTSK